MNKENLIKTRKKQDTNFLLFIPYTHHSGITLVALVVTIIVLLILAGVTITILFSDNGIIKKAQDAAESTNVAVEDELQGMNDLGDKMNSILEGTGTGGDNKPTDPTANWDLNKVTKVESDDNKIVPVPVGFTASTVAGEKSVSTGFVIKQGDNGGATSGVNEFVWVPVTDSSSMFGTDVNENSLGKLYKFSGTSSSPLNWTEENKVMTWEDSESYREPDISVQYDGNDLTFTSAIGNITGEEFKQQLQIEFEEMRESIETYGGFYIGRYETGNLGQAKAVVQKNNEDINQKNWYEMYKKCKTIAEGTSGTSSMIWGCQWDATLRWFLTSTNPEIVTYVTNSTEKGNYNTGQPIPTGSIDKYSVNKIYDMAGNVIEWTLEAGHSNGRVHRGGDYDDSGSTIPVFYYGSISPNGSHKYQRLQSNTLC